MLNVFCQIDHLLAIGTWLDRRKLTYLLYNSFHLIYLDSVRLMNVSLLETTSLLNWYCWFWFLFIAGNRGHSGGFRRVFTSLHDSGHLVFFKLWRVVVGKRRLTLAIHQYLVIHFFKSCSVWSIRNLLGFKLKFTQWQSFRGVRLLHQRRYIWHTLISPEESWGCWCPRLRVQFLYRGTTTLLLFVHDLRET